MRIQTRSILSRAVRALPALSALALLAALAPSASATDGAVYTMNNDTAGNDVVVLQRDEDTGMLTMQTTVATGGNGTGASLDSQSSMVLSADEKYLLVVNAGSNTLSSLAVTETGLELRDTASTGGFKPVSVDIHDDIIAVLNAGGDVGEKDTVSLLRLEADGTLDTLNRTRDLSADSTSPVQVAFVQEGRVLVVTEKDTNKIVTYRLRYNATIKGSPQVFDHTGLQPAGFTSIMRDQILVTDTTTGTVTSYHVTEEGVVSPLGHTTDTTELATNWIVALPGARTVFTTNTNSDSVTGLHVNFDADLLLQAVDGVTATTGDAPIDAALSDDGQFLYVLAAGTDAINAYSVNDDGSLTAVETEPGIPANAQGMASR